MTSKLHVLFSSNRPYLPYLLTALTSLRHSLSSACALSVTVLSRDLNAGEIAWRNRGDRDELRCFAPEIPEGEVLPIRSGDHLTVETYYRLFLESALPLDARRAIYLDADLVVLSDLSPLRTMDLRGRTVGAVRDFVATDWSACSPPLPSGGSAGRNPYFNAGVLVIDVERWRRLAIRHRALEFLRRNATTMRYWDQDALNYVLVGDWHEIDPRWNRGSNYWNCVNCGTLPFDASIVQSLRNPFIVHFATPVKPWMSYRHPDRRHFDRFALMAGVGGSRMNLWRAVRRAMRLRLSATVSKLLGHRQGAR